MSRPTRGQCQALKAKCYTGVSSSVTLSESNVVVGDVLIASIAPLNFQQLFIADQ